MEFILSFIISAIIYLSVPLIIKFTSKEKIDTKNAWAFSITNFIILKLIIWIILSQIMVETEYIEYFNPTSGWIYIIIGYFIIKSAKEKNINTNDIEFNNQDLSDDEMKKIMIKKIKTKTGLPTPICKECIDIVVLIEVENNEVEAIKRIKEILIPKLLDTDSTFDIEVAFSIFLKNEDINNELKQTISELKTQTIQKLFEIKNAY